MQFQDFLRSALVRRCHKNPRYSLRAFAKNLDIDCSTLSKLMNGKRPLSRKMTHILAMKLGLKQAEIKKFLEESARSEIAATTQTPAHSHSHTYDVLADDISAVISDWYHYAILELLRVDGLKLSVKTAAKALGLTVHEVSDALQRLQRLNLLKIEGHGWVDLTSGRTTDITENATSFARKAHQKQVLEKAIAAIEDVAIEKRNNTSMTFAIDTEKLPEAIALIKKFRRQMGELLSRGEKRDEVYNLAVALYPISKIKEGGVK